MSKKAQYRTKQMKELLSYLESVQGQHVTVSDISGYFKDRGIPIGTTTIYRHLEKMIGQGSVVKYIVDEGSSACFEYLGEREQCAKPVCYHCKCEKCGKLIHLQCDEVMNLYQHMRKKHGFEMDPLRTVFYGTCEECREKKAGE